MIPKKMIIGIVTLVILVSAAVYTNFGAGVDSGARYNYELDLSDTFVSKEGHIERPEDGMQWAILSYAVTNDDYRPCVSTNRQVWEWRLMVDGQTYPSTNDSYDHPGYVIRDVYRGETNYQTLVFSIPASVSLSDITVSQNYTIRNNGFEKDDSIKVLKVTQSVEVYRYDHRLEFISDTALGDDICPGSGMRFLKVTYAIVNDSATVGVSMGSFYFEWAVQTGGQRYEQSEYYSTIAPGYSGATVKIGQQGMSVCVIEVPIDSNIDDMKVSFKYNGFYESLGIFDDTLL